MRHPPLEREGRIASAIRGGVAPTPAKSRFSPPPAPAARPPLKGEMSVSLLFTSSPIALLRRLQGFAVADEPRGAGLVRCDFAQRLEEQVARDRRAIGSGRAVIVERLEIARQRR